MKRRKFPDGAEEYFKERPCVVHAFELPAKDDEAQDYVAKFTIRVGLFEDGAPGEVFLGCGESGTTLSGMLDAFSIMVSMGLQYGIPLEVMCDKFSRTRFPPNGIVQSGVLSPPMATSPLDYAFRWLYHKFSSTGETASGSEGPTK